MSSPIVIRVEVADQYGVKVMRPANDAARSLAKLAGTKTLTTTTLRIAKHELGMDVQVEQRDTAFVASLIN